jgi:D-mannonate dehydratase
MTHNNEPVTQIQTDNPSVFAFMIRGEVTSEDMEGMARIMNTAFDAHKSVSMLLIFDHFEGREVTAGWDTESMKAQFRSLSKVEKYAVVGAPSAASAMIAFMDKIIPVDARTFAAMEETEAWGFVGAQPITV